MSFHSWWRVRMIFICITYSFHFPLFSYYRENHSPPIRNCLPGFEKCFIIWVSAKDPLKGRGKNKLPTKTRPSTFLTTLPLFHNMVLYCIMLYCIRLCCNIHWSNPLNYKLQNKLVNVNIDTLASLFSFWNILCMKTSWIVYLYLFF